MSRLKAYLYANLYLLLPVLLLTILLPVLIPRMTDWVEPEVRRSYTACHFQGGGGSINFCENEIWWRGLKYGVIAATISAWVVSQLVIWVLHIRWRSPLYGVVFFWGASFGVLCFSTIVHNHYSNEASDVLRELNSVIVSGLALAVSWFNYKRYVRQQVIEQSSN